MSSVLSSVIEEYRRKLFLEGLNEDFAALRADPEAWRAEEEERRAWDNALADGLDTPRRSRGSGRGRCMA